MTAGRLPISAGRIVAALLVLALATVSVACSSTPNLDGSLAASVLATLPVPPSATLTVGSDGPGVDGDARFYAYTSAGTPKAELAAFDAALRAANFQPITRTGAWTAYRRAGVTVWVSVSVDGPPTSIVALVGADPASTAIPAPLAADPSAGALIAQVPALGPATPEPRSRAGGGSSASPAGAAAGGRSPKPGDSHGPAGSPAPAASPQPTGPDASHKPKPSHPVKPSPTNEPASTSTPKPKPSPKPTPTSQPSPSATPAPTPTPTPKPKPTPKPTHGSSNGGSSQ